MLHERLPTGWRDSRKRVSEVCMRDPVADGLRNWMLIKLLICKGYSEASPVTWDCLEIYGMERRCRLTYETSTECNLVRDNVGVYCANEGHFRLDYLPPYSPDLNPIERGWLDGTKAPKCG